jgi:gas vesicle protein
MTQQAEAAAEDFKKGLIDGMREAAREVDKVEDAVDDVGKTAKKAGEESANAFEKAASAYKVAAAAALSVAGAFASIRKVLSDGDAFGDVRDAFTESAQAAGVAADALRNNLSEALEGTVSNFDLMVLANKAFASNLPVEAFDELAFAARKFAERTGGDATEAMDQLIQALRTGRESALIPFGIAVKGGVVVLDQLTKQTVEQANASGGASTALEGLVKTFKDLYSDTAAAVNESQEYARYLRALGETAEIVGSVLGGVFSTAVKFGSAIASFTAPALESLNALLRDLANGFALVGELSAQVARKEMPSISKAAATVARELAKVSKETDKAGKVTIRLKKDASEAGKALGKDVADGARKAAEEIEKLWREATTNIEKAFGFKTILEAKVEKEVQAAFQQFSTSDAALVSALDKINKALLDGILDPEDAKKRVDILMDAIDSELQKRQKTTAAGLGGKASPSSAESFLGGLFGFDPSQIGEVDFEVLGSTIGSGVQQSIQMGLEGITRDNAAAFGAAVGGVIGAVVGTIVPVIGTAVGAAVGTVVGGVIGSVAAQLGEDKKGTEIRKQIDSFFAELFDVNRVSAVINGQIVRINDLVFEGLTNFGGQVDFGGEGFFDVINGMSEQARAGVTGLGAAFGELAGVTEEEARLIGAALVNNIGTSLENLRELVKATGKSFEDLSEAMLQAFYDGILTIEELYEGMKKLEEVFSVGFPDAIGDVTRALDNLNTAMQDGRGSRALFDSIRDAAQEATEVGMSFDTLVAQLGSALGLTAQQAVVLMEFLKKKGIDTAAELRDASIAELLALLEAARRIVDAGQDIAAGAAAADQVTVPTDPTAGVEPPGLFNRGGPVSSGSSGGSGNSASRAADERKREAQRQREELYKLLTASAQYEKILASLNSESITQVEASKQIRELYREISSATKALEDAEKRYKKALEDRGKSQKELAKIAAEVDRAQKRVDDLTDRARQANAVPKFDISGALALTQTVNELAIVSRAAGLSLEGLTGPLVEGFLRGKVSITDFRTELDKLEETFSDGIPKAAGDVGQAIRNLFEGGKSGGLFSVDAFKDVFAEYEELFSSQSSDRRKAQLAQLTAEFDQARDALQNAINGGASPGSIDDLRTQFDGARKALEDFKQTPNKAGLEDLRDTLRGILSPDQTDAFFEALRANGVTTFDQIRTAGPEAITRILASLDELGFGFGETSERVKGIIGELDRATVAQSEGKDVLKEALDLVTNFNVASERLGPSFDSAATAVERMEGPLAAIASRVSDTVNLLSQLGGNTFDNDVVLNVRVQGENGAVNLVDVLFGDGAGSDGGAGGSGPGLNADEEREFQGLKRRRQNGRLSASDRARFIDLRRRRNGR